MEKNTINNGTDARPYHKLFLCGQLNTSKRNNDVINLNNGWESVVVPENEYKNLCDTYYESFVNSLINRGNSDGEYLYSQTAHLVKNYNRTCSINIPEDESDALKVSGYEFKVTRVHLFFFPYNICIFAVEINESAEVNLEDLVLVHSSLRNNNSYWVKTEVSERKLDAPDYLEIIQDLLDICTVKNKNGETTHIGCYSDLSCTGNKLKCFQIINTSEDVLADDLLYELGAMSPVGCVKNHNDYSSPSKTYYNALMKDSLISVFRQWKGLALFDSFTILARNERQDSIEFKAKTYFRLIYMHALFQKTLLFSMNKIFRTNIKSEESIKLLHDIKEQEHWYAFSNISYNFLPQLLYEYIDKGLNIANERKVLHEYMQQEAERLEKISEQKIGRYILYLTLLTITSILCDGTSFIKEFFNDQAYLHTKISYIFGGSIISIVLIIFFLNNLKPVKKFIWKLYTKATHSSTH